jgi:SulP family sulfate permease
MGLVRLGTLVNFVSHTVVIGFTAGAAILIAASQLKHALGIELDQGLDFGRTIIETFKNIDRFNPFVLLIASVTLATAILVKKLSSKIPHMLVAMLIGSMLTWLIGAEPNGIKLVGKLPSGLPNFSIPEFDPELWFKLVPDAFAIALLGLIEAVAIARSIGSQSGQRIDGNREFIGQGLSNIVGSFFSCYPGSGSFTRSGINYQSGAKTPMAAIFAAILLMLIVLFIAPLTAYLPLPAMAGLIMLVAYNLIDFKHIKTILKAGKRETTVMLITFFSTLFLDLEFAIYIGVIFSLILYLRATSRPRLVELTPDPAFHNNKLINVERKELPVCPQLKIIRFDGTLFFGAIEHAIDEIETMTADVPKYVLFVLSGVNLIDMSGAEMLQTIQKKLKSRGVELYLGAVKKPVREYLEKGNFIEHIGKNRVFIDEEDALKAIYAEMDKQICNSCPAQVFSFCPKNQ